MHSWRDHDSGGDVWATNKLFPRPPASLRCGEMQKRLDRIVSGLAGHIQIRMLPADRELIDCQRADHCNFDRDVGLERWGGACRG